MKKWSSCLAAIVLAAVCYAAARLPSLSDAEKTRLASQFRFTKLPLTEISNAPPHKTVRAVHPSLQRISAWISSIGAAATLADLDEDGLPNDVIHVDPRTDLVTIAPVPGVVERYKPFALDRSAWSRGGYDAATIAPTGTVAGDFNEDGLMDVLVYFWGRTPLLYLRTSFPLTASAFVARELTESGERWFTDCATQADLDGDGHVDLLFGNYFPDQAHVLDPKATGTETMHEGKAKALNGGQKHVFLWQSATRGDTTSVAYREVKNVFPENITRGWAVALGAADLDGDLLPEIYFAHDFGPDRLLHNRSTPGQLKFVEVVGRRDFTTPKSCVLGNDSFKGMGCDFADINGDGLLDIYVSNIATKFGLMESHFLWQSTGHTQDFQNGFAPYVQASEKLGLSRSGFGWDARLADFNNDGVREAVQACGFIKGKINRWPELQALGTSNDRVVHNPKFWPSFKPGADLSGNDWNPFFVRGESGRYFDLARSVGLGEAMVSRGLAIADTDGDGRLDFVCANQWGPSYFIHNDSPAVGEFLGLRLQRGNGTPLVGAFATVALADGRKMVGYVDGGSGHSGRCSPDIHFGLGKSAEKRLTVELKWRGEYGKVESSTRRLAPGWHTIRLSGDAAQTAALP